MIMILSSVSQIGKSISNGFVHNYSGKMISIKKLHFGMNHIHSCLCVCLFDFDILISNTYKQIEQLE